MDLQAQRLQIIEEVLHLDGSDLEELTYFLAKRKLPVEENFDDIPPMPRRSAEEVAAELAESIREMQRGETVSHEEVVALTQQWRAA